MSVALTSKQVWDAVGKQMFAVLGTVSRAGQPRTAGIVYKVKDEKFYIATAKRSIKARNVEQNPYASLTITLAKRIPFLPWIKVPPATITFQGRAKLYDHAGADLKVAQALTGKLKLSEAEQADLCVIEVAPQGNFVTYGVGVPLMAMINPDEASGRAPVT